MEKFGELLASRSPARGIQVMSGQWSERGE